MKIKKVKNLTSYRLNVLATSISTHPNLPSKGKGLAAFTLAEGATHVGICDNVRRCAFTLAEGATHVGICDNVRRCAFTLAEVLITLGIIGVVAAMTIPTLMVDINSKQWSTAKDVFNKKLNESLKTMNTQQVISGHTSTLSFVEELSNHFKINKICKNDELQNCFNETIYWGAGDATPEEIDMSIIKNAKNFGLDWDTELIGVQFANGVTGLVAYNPECWGDPYSNQFEGTGCISMLYDVSGAKNPNTSGKDISNYGVISKLGSGCFAEINGVCLASAPFVPTPMTFEECTGYTSTHTGTNTATSAGGEAAALGISQCYYANDYWAGAVKACGGTSKMATSAQLTELANYVYNTTGLTTSYTSGLTLDTAKAAELGITSSYFHLWSREEVSATYAYVRYFTSSYTYRYGYDRGLSDLLAVCLGD